MIDVHDAISRRLPDNPPCPEGFFKKRNYMNINIGTWTKTTDPVANTATWKRDWTLDDKLFASVLVTTNYELRKINSYVTLKMAVPDTEITISINKNDILEVTRQVDFNERGAMQKITRHINKLIKEYTDGK